MDMSMVAAVMMQQAGALQQQVATSTLKSNLDAQKDTILTLLGGAQQTLANVGPGIGGSVNISA